MPVTLGRSDAILVVQLIESLPCPLEKEIQEDIEDLLAFIKIQLNSIAEEEAKGEIP